MIKADKVIESAREFLGTPWQHGARLKDVGIDCTGLIISSLNENGAGIEDINDYSIQDEFVRLARELKSRCSKHDECLEDFDLIQKADILVFRAEDMMNHVALYSGEGTIIHAYSVPAVNQVVEQKFDGYWKFRLVGVYRYKELKQ